MTSRRGFFAAVVLGGLLGSAFSSLIPRALSQGGLIPTTFVSWPAWAITNPAAIAPYSGFVPLVAADGSQMTTIPIANFFTTDRNIPLSNLAGGVGAGAGTFLSGSPSPDGSWAPAYAGGGTATTNIISTGVTNTLATLAVPHTTQEWTSASNGIREQYIPACTAAIAGYAVSVVDAAGIASTWDYVINPAGGTINSGPAFGLNTNFASITFQCDGVSNWMPL